MSHEIRTPLNAVLGMMQLAMETEDTQARRDFIGKAHRSSKVLLGIINDILDFSKIEAGKLVIEQKNFVLKPLVAELVDIFGAIASEKNVQLSVEYAPDVPNTLCGDPLGLVGLQI